MSTHVRTIAPSILCASGVPTSNSQGEPPRTHSAALRPVRKSLPHCLRKKSATATRHVAFSPKPETTASSHWDAKGDPIGMFARRVSGILLATTFGGTPTWDSLTPCRKRLQLPSFLRPTVPPFVPAHLQDAVTARTQSIAAPAVPLAQYKPLLISPSLRTPKTSHEDGAKPNEKHHYFKNYIEKCKRQNLRTRTRA